MTEKIMKAADDGQLQKGIHPWMAGLIALGGIIGSCYFIGSGWIVQELGPSSVVAFLLGGLIVYVVMQSFAELLVNIPRQGSFVSYSREFISPLWAVGTGWSYWLNWIAYVPSEAVAGGMILTKLFGNISLFGEYTQAFWAFVFLTVITIINLSNVENFGRIESTLVILKIVAISTFIICGILIITGVLGGQAVGTQVIFPKGEFRFKDLFPAGIYPIFGFLALVLVNFHGSEIIGLAAAETKDPETTVPKACRQVTYRILGIYVLPLTVLVLILSRTDSGLNGSMFAAALNNYSKILGISWLHYIASGFAFIVLTAAFSCANSGMFATVRAMYALSLEGLAPKAFSKLSKNGVPKNATFFTLFCCWATLVFNVLFGKSNAYAILLSISGFTGTICWISICLSQMSFRKKIRMRGYSVRDLNAPAKLSPFLPALIGIILPTAGLLLMLGDPRVLIATGSFTKYLSSADPSLQGAFLLSMAAMSIPMIVFAIGQKNGRVHLPNTVQKGEKEFDELFPGRHAIKLSKSGDPGVDKKIIREAV